MRKNRVSEGIVSGSIGMIARMAAQLCLLAVTLTATRLLKVSEFGIYSIAASLMVLSRNLFYVGPYEYLLKTPDAPGLKGACLKANMVLAALAMLVLLIISAVAQISFHGTELPYLLARLAPSLLLSAPIGWYEALLLRGMAIRRYYLFTVIGELLASVASITCFALGFGILSLVVQIYTRLVVLLAIYVLTIDDADWRSGTWREVVVIIRWSWSRFGAVLLNFSGNYGADFVLAVALSPAATGIYRASNRVVSAISDLFAQPLQKIVQTNLSARSARGLEPDQLWISMLLGVAAIGWATLIGLGVAASVAVPVVLGPAWKPAVPVVMIFCYGRALSLIDVTTTSLLVCCDRQRFMLVVQTIVAVAVPGASLLTALYLGKSASYAPMAVAAVNVAIMSGLTVTYGLKAARLSQSSVTVIVHSLALALIPGLCVGVGVFALNQLGAPGRMPPVLVLGGLMVAGAVGLGVGLMLIRERLLASIAALGAPVHVAEKPA